MKLAVPPIEALAPKTAEKLLRELSEEDASHHRQHSDQQEENNSELLPVTVGSCCATSTADLVTYLPAKLSLNIDAPPDAVLEMTQCFIICKDIMVKLAANSKPGKPHPQLLGYIRQTGDLADKLYKMTESVQNEVQLEKIKTIRAMFETNPDLSEEFKIRFLKEMRNKIKVAES